MNPEESELVDDDIKRNGNNSPKFSAVYQVISWKEESRDDYKVLLIK
jgi:hypothetical protein